MTTSIILSPNTDAELEALLLKARHRISVLIYSTAWCKNCKRLSSGLEKLADELKAVATFIHVDVDELEKTVQRYNIESLPTFQLFRGHVLQTSISAAQLPRKSTPEESDDQLLGWIATTVASFSKHWNASYSKITDHLAFSPTPTEYQIKEGLVKVGFKSVIGTESKQNPGEYNAKEGDLWREHGIEYISYPIESADEISLHDFDEILQLVETLPGPILFHSDIGQIAAIFVFAMVAKQNARKGSEVPEWARELGFDFDGLGKLTQTISAWVDK
ncbi:Thioredoxin-like protein 1 [Mortierella antarctica]|nr:Thioredoxin-like protein 1 [Mortierella antarctica]KAG0346362.1 Thioredoxin-like protein 1 [Podila minutissima]